MHLEDDIMNQVSSCVIFTLHPKQGCMIMMKVPRKIMVDCGKRNLKGDGSFLMMVPFYAFLVYDASLGEALFHFLLLRYRFKIMAS